MGSVIGLFYYLFGVLGLLDQAVCEKNFDDENYKWEGACLGARLTSDVWPITITSKYVWSESARKVK